MDAQYVLLDDEGTKEYGVWLIPEDEPERPFVVSAKREASGDEKP